MIPIVAIIGRPNVGKSTLFNRLAGANLAIVHDAPGVTRDRHYGEAEVYGREITLIDTGGFEPDSKESIGHGIARHVRAAIDEADLIVCVLDANGLHEQDRAAVQLLRRAEKPVVYAANKVDNDRLMHESNELFQLGVPDLIHISALHGRGTHELLQRISTRLPAGETDRDREEPTDGAPRLALIGRPNAGKSSLFNRLAQSERSLVDAAPGTTRDPVDTVVSFQGREFLLVDTAGIRRRARVHDGVEAASVIRSIRAIAGAEAVVLMCDASEGIAEQDARLLGLCVEKKRAILVGMNKMDLLSKKQQAEVMERARTTLHFAPWAPLLPLSAKTGRGVSELMSEVFTAVAAFRQRVPTSQLNRFFEQVLERHAPPTRGGRAPRIYYVTQAKSAPPVFVAMSNAPEHIAASYRRFVQNQIRKTFGFHAVPVIVEYRKRSSNRH